MGPWFNHPDTKKLSLPVFRTLLRPPFVHSRTQINNFVSKHDNKLRSKEPDNKEKQLTETITAKSFT